MLISKTSQYAIQAMIYMASLAPETYVRSCDIARQLYIPTTYLAKIMMMLGKGGLVKSYRGPAGGYCLPEESDNTSLMQILLVTEGDDFIRDCVLGLKICGDETACPMHQRWQTMKVKIIDLLNQQTLLVLKKAVQNGEYLIWDIPEMMLIESS